MSTLSTPQDSAPPLEESPYQQYRSLSTTAVATLVLAALSLFALLYPPLLLLPVLAILLGLYSLASIRRRSDELAGSRLAGIGLAMAAVLLVGATALHATIYVLEVPEGHARVAFWQLHPPEGAPEEAMPPFAHELEGQQIFIKGYVYPGSMQTGITNFLLVGDRGTCCFGGNPKITDRMQISLRSGESLTYSTGLFKVAGTFRIRPMRQAIDGPGGVLYHLEEAQLR